MRGDFELVEDADLIGSGAAHKFVRRTPGMNPVGRPTHFSPLLGVTSICPSCSEARMYDHTRAS